MFPLYETIKKDMTTRKDLNSSEKKEFMDFIQNITDNNVHINMYKLILNYNMENDKQKTNIPYGIESELTRIKLNLLKFPPRLRRILYIYMKIHKKTLEAYE